MIRFEIVPRGQTDIAVREKPGRVTQLVFSDSENRSVFVAWLTAEQRDRLRRMLEQ